MTWQADSMSAIIHQDLQALKGLIDDDPARLNFACAMFPNWLWEASAKGSLEMVKYLCEIKGLSPDANHEEFGNAVAHAASWSRSDLVEYFLSCGARLDTSKSNWNPLFAAVSGGSTDVVRQLLEAGIDSRIKYALLGSEAPMGAYELALEHGRSEIAELIRSNNERLGS